MDNTFQCYPGFTKPQMGLVNPDGGYGQNDTDCGCNLDGKIF